MKSILKMVDGIFISKVRYGIQLLGKVRLNDQEPECGDLNAIQMVMNKLLRTLNGSKVVNRISTESLLVKFGISSVNQLLHENECNNDGYDSRLCITTVGIITKVVFVGLFNHPIFNT